MDDELMTALDPDKPRPTPLRAEPTLGLGHDLTAFTAPRWLRPGSKARVSGSPLPPTAATEEGFQPTELTGDIYR